MSLRLGFDGRIRSVTTLVRELATEFRQRDLPFMAGSIAYSAFVSLLPMLLLLLLLASLLGSQALRQFITAATRTYLTPAGQNIIVDAVTQGRPRTYSLLGVAVLVWGVLNVFRGLDTAFSKLYETTGQNGFLDQLKDGLIVLFGIGLAIIAMFIAGVVYAYFQNVPFIRIINLVVLVLALSVAFLPIYYVFPDVNVTVREILPGVVVAAVGWTVLQALFQVYIQFSKATQLYGVLGGIILLITWLYIAALVLLIGGAVNVILARRSQPAAEAATRSG